MSRERVVAAVLVATLGISSTATACAHDGPRNSAGFGRFAAADLVGAWIATVTVRSCSDRAVVLSGPFQAIVVFHAGGTLSEAAAPGASRTPSFGTWSRTGKREFHADSVFLTFVGGSFAGTQEIRRGITVSEDGRSFVAVTRTIVRNVDGLEQGPEGCALGEATRFE
jgi:hypothetical protein